MLVTGKYKLSAAIILTENEEQEGGVKMKIRPREEKTEDESAKCERNKRER